MKAYLIFDSERQNTGFLQRAWTYIKTYGEEIEMPEGATEFHCWSGNMNEANVFHFPIPCPKAKVKKYIWAIPKGGKVEITEKHYSEKEMESYNKIEPFLFWYHRIDETMVEVEE